ncbi:MAG: hypothetical protein IPL75_03620 [Acidobacteria bacterium]|jgi:hypothetical protein|nr:hypothetical protein [Acidobacteriota bacterium]
MIKLLIAAIVTAGLAPVRAQQVYLTPSEVADAIKQGQAGKSLQKKCRASGENGFDIIVEGPTGRTMRAAREAKAQGRVFTPDDVSLALGGPFLTVTARRDHTLTAASLAEPLPGAPGMWVLPEFAKDERRLNMFTQRGSYRADIVLRARPAGSREPVVLKPMAPAVYTGTEGTWNSKTRTHRPLPDTNMSATFDLVAFRALPPSTVDVVVFMSDAGEHRCKISDKDRQTIR